jgi:hypothetical protein
VLSAALVYFDQTQTYTYQQLIENSCFVKFNAKEQVEQYKRKVEKSTLDWWKEQEKEVQQISMFPSKNDVSAEKGIKILKEYIRDNTKEKNEICWIRGTLDQCCMDSLCKDLKVPFLFNYYQFRDVRTALDLIKETTKKGYCKIPNFDYKQVRKHNPVDDVCLDAFMLLYGE